LFWSLNANEEDGSVCFMRAGSADGGRGFFSHARKERKEIRCFRRLTIHKLSYFSIFEPTRQRLFGKMVRLDIFPADVFQLLRLDDAVPQH
jgi:hypothetical protein